MTYVDASLARNSTGPTTSSTAPGRPSEVWRATQSAWSSTGPVYSVANRARNSPPTPPLLFGLRRLGGPAEHVKIACLHGRRFLMLSERLTSR